MIESNTLTPPLIGRINLCKQIYHMVCLTKIVLDVIVISLITKFLKLVLECA